MGEQTKAVWSIPPRRLGQLVGDMVRAYVDKRMNNNPDTTVLLDLIDSLEKRVRTLERERERSR